MASISLHNKNSDTTVTIKDTLSTTREIILPQGGNLALEPAGRMLFHYDKTSLIGAGNGTPRDAIITVGPTGDVKSIEEAIEIFRRRSITEYNLDSKTQNYIRYGEDNYFKNTAVRFTFYTILLLPNFRLTKPILLNGLSFGLTITSNNQPIECEFDLSIKNGHNPTLINIGYSSNLVIYNLYLKIVKFKNNLSNSSFASPGFMLSAYNSIFTTAGCKFEVDETACGITSSAVRPHITGEYYTNGCMVYSTNSNYDCITRGLVSWGSYTKYGASTFHQSKYYRPISSGAWDVPVSAYYGIVQSTDSVLIPNPINESVCYQISYGGIISTKNPTTTAKLGSNSKICNITAGTVNKLGLFFTME